jgi:hypothetical protein
MSGGKTFTTVLHVTDNTIDVPTAADAGTDKVAVGTGSSHATDRLIEQGIERATAGYADDLKELPEPIDVEGDAAAAPSTDPVGIFLLKVFSQWKARENAPFKPGIDNYEASKAFVLPYYTSRFANDDVFNPLTYSVRTPIEVTRIAYDDRGDAGIEVEVEGRQCTGNATNDLSVDSLMLVRDGTKLLIDRHTRTARNADDPSSQPQVQAGGNDDRDEFLRRFDKAWDDFRLAWEDGASHEAIRDARMALSAFYTDGAGVDAMNVTSSDQIYTRFASPTPTWSAGEVPLRNTRTGKVSKQYGMTEDVTLVGGPGAYRVGSHTKTVDEA